MASTRETRSATGKSAPRKLFTIEPTTTTTRKTKTKTTTKTTGKPKANMSKPRAKATTTGRVEKKAPAKKRKTSVGDKVKGLVEKAEGKIERKPGKKVRYARSHLAAVLESNQNSGVVACYIFCPCEMNGDMLTTTSHLQAAGTKKIKGTDGKGRPKKTAAVV